MESFLFKAFGYLKGLLYYPRLKNPAPVRVHGFPKIKKHNGTVQIGKRTTIWPGVKFSAISKQPDKPAQITVGKYSSIGDNTQIHCCNNITIGDRVLISWGVNILENYYHTTGGGDESIKSAPIIIENKVWIGCNAIILAGVTIGEGSVVAAGAVVTKNVTQKSLVAGNPAKVIRQTEPWS